MSRFPQTATRLACSLECVADGGGVPLAAALGGGDAVGVESVRESRLEAPEFLESRVEDPRCVSRVDRDFLQLK
jgi:hypothetical protein